MTGGRYLDRILAPPNETAAPLAAPPSFSVVVRAYQAASTVGAAVASALAQVHAADQVIVVDDGSTDALDEALTPFVERIEIVRQSNRGGASALNAGAAVAASEFVVVLDADDTYHPRRLQALAALAVARPDLDLLTTDARLVLDGAVVGRFAAATPFCTEDQRAGILLSCFVGGWPAIRAERLAAVGGLDESLRVGHDWDCWVRLILEGASAGMIDEPLYDYHLHPSGLTASRDTALGDRVRLLEKASRNPSLRPGDRSALEAALRHHRTRAVQAQTAAPAGGGGGRRRLLAAAATPGIGVATRARAALAAVAPATLRGRGVVVDERDPRS